MPGGIFLLLGSNLGDRQENIAEAQRRIGLLGRLRTSPSYMTGAWGNKLQPDFINKVIEIETKLPPEELLKNILAIETAMGRVRTEKWGPRVIDIDILFYDSQIVNTPDLTIPHPQIQFRKFALEPLNDIAGTFIHPVLKKTIEELLRECTDPLEVTRLPQQP